MLLCRHEHCLYFDAMTAVCDMSPDVVVIVTSFTVRNTEVWLKAATVTRVCRRHVMLDSESN